MIHRSLGPRLACIAAFATAVAWAEHVRACLTTTCAVKNPPAECVRDIATDCWLAGAPLTWQQACVSFSVDHHGLPALGLDYPDTEALVLSSFALWTAAACADGFPTISVMSMAPLECMTREFNPDGPNSNGVIFRTDRWPYAPEAIGITTVTFDPETGKLMDADIEVNIVDGDLDLGEVQYVVAHEAGHFFGIDHSADASAVMYMTRSLGACDFESEKGFSPVCGGDIEGSCSLSPRDRSPIGPMAMLFVAALGALVLRAKTTLRLARKTPGAP
jgi:hypothetical protein